MRVPLAVPLALEEIAAATGAKFNGINASITHITTDTRHMECGDLFIALGGNNAHGSDFVSSAKKIGGYTLSYSSQSTDLSVNDTSQALLLLSEYYKSKLPKIISTVAITGSVGKTTTKEFLRELLSSRYKVHSTFENENNTIGVPLTVLGCAYDADVLLLECGMNHRGELSAISICVHPDISVITNIGTSHIGHLGSREEIARAKLEICDGMTQGALICRAEDKAMLEYPRTKTVSLAGHESHFRAENVRRYGSGFLFDFCCQNDVISDIFFPIDAEHLLPNAVMATAVAYSLGLSKDDIRSGIGRLSDKSVRHKFIKCGEFTILDDSYNASRESVIAAMDMLANCDATVRSALLGDILELGEYGPKIHREIGRRAAQMNLARLYLFGELSRFTKQGALENGMSSDSIFLNEDTNTPEITAETLREKTIPGEVILFKASHRMGLYRIINMLKGRD